MSYGCNSRATKGSRVMMKPIKSLISLEQAKELLSSHVVPVDRIEEVGLLAAHTRVLAGTIVAPIDVPPFDRAAMDGYAVRAEDTFSAGGMHPVILGVKGFVPAGVVSEQLVDQGSCIQVATGSPLPGGADAVVMVEDTEEENAGHIRVYKAVHPRANVSSAGADIKQGEQVLTEGDVLTPSRIGTLAALGMASVDVYVRPRVAVISSGEEIVVPGQPLTPGRIYDVNSYTIASLVEENGCMPEIQAKLGDNLDDIIEGVRKVYDVDLIVITGGSSVGERDLIGQAIAGLGRLLFHGIAVKPGKPTLAADIEGTLLIGMPGYPTSCLTNGYELSLIHI